MLFPSQVGIHLPPPPSYKSKARHESLSDALGVSLGTLRQNERALYTSLKAHEKATTEKVIQASLRDRGIFPWFA